jgi:hypothetical protein
VKESGPENEQQGNGEGAAVHISSKKTEHG